MRLMFDNCLTYHCAKEVTPIHWYRDPCKLLYNELNLLAPTLPPDAKKADFLRVIESLKKIRLEIKKPWAPIRLPLKTVSVEIVRGKHTAYIALGSNMGGKENYIRDAVNKLGQIRGCTVRAVSDLIETPPYGVTDQDDFLNGCLELETLLTPRELLKELNRIEAESGRERIVHWGPRTLDLDIIFYDDITVQEKDLCIPHVEMHKRKFVLEPLSQIAPYKRHPVYGKTVTEMLEELQR